MPRYKLRTLLNLLAVGPPLLAGGWWLSRFIGQGPAIAIGPWELFLLALVGFICFGNYIPSITRTFFRDFFL
jgi:hypothetical protein